MKSLLSTSGKSFRTSDLFFKLNFPNSSAFKCAKAVWPIFQKQKFGRIVTTSSQAGVCEFSALTLSASLAHCCSQCRRPAGISKRS